MRASGEMRGMTTIPRRVIRPAESVNEVATQARGHDRVKRAADDGGRRRVRRETHSELSIWKTDVFSCYARADLEVLGLDFARDQR